MMKADNNPIQQEEKKTQGDASEIQGKQPFEDPKLTYVIPKLTKHGKVEDITAGFFGTFYP